jgi:uncharacterized protein (TIGR03437 family)
MAVDGNNVHIAVSNYGNKAGGTWYGILTYIRSGDGGASFEAPKALFSADEVYHVYDIRAVTDQGKTSIGFRVQCNYCVNNGYVLMTTSDGGRSFKQQSVYSTTSGSGWNVYDLKRSGDNVYVLYTDTYFYYGLGYRNLYIAASSNDGASFKSQMISVPSKNNSHKTGNLSDYNYSPKIAVNNRDVYVVWNSLDQDDKQQLFFRKSTDNGVTFSTPLNLTTTAKLSGSEFQQGQETIAAANGKVYIAFLRNDASIFLMRSLDAGASFQPPQELTSSAYWSDGGWWPTLTIDPNDPTGSRVYVFWKSPQYVLSTDSGATFSRPVLVSNHFSWRGNDPSRPRFAIGPDGVLHWAVEGTATWYSTGSFGDSDIFYRRVEPVAAPSPARSSLRLSSFTNRGDGTGMERFDNMSIPATPDLNFTTAMTAEVWVKPYPDGVTTGFTDEFKPIFHKRETADAYRSAYLIGTGGPQNAKQPFARINTWVSATSVEATSISPPNRMGFITDGVWTHLAFTYDSTVAKGHFILYINGKAAATGTATGSIASGDGTLFAGYFGSWEIAELRFWNRALGPSEVLSNARRLLANQEPGLVAYYTFANTTRDVTGRGNDGMLMYQESYIPSTLVVPPPTFVSAVTHAASYAEGAAPESIVSLFGSGLAKNEAGAATVPLPTNLGGTSVNVRDLAREDRLAPLFYAGPGQINFTIPSGTYPSTVEVTVTSPLGQDRTWLQVGKVAPGIFAANGSGKGTAAGTAVIATAGGGQQVQNLYNVDLSPAFIDLGGPNDQVYLVLYGTGLRGFAAKPAATVGAASVPVVVTAQSQFVGLDQINIGPLPASLRGAGVVSVIVSGDGQRSNPVTIAVR